MTTTQEPTFREVWEHIRTWVIDHPAAWIILYALALTILVVS